ncbi:hypothetical protein XH89_10115 [Bradyrhizobium sp. CCBAU 53340]|nr:hypothetical protein XH89_10115 [Bradyrhizobium sp. CCBAU 53340]
MLATTIFVAVSSLTAIGPASAHGFGGFGGGAAFASRSSAVAAMPQAPGRSMNSFNGGRFDRAPSISPSTTVSERARIMQEGARTGQSVAPGGKSSINPQPLPPRVEQQTTGGGTIFRPGSRLTINPQTTASPRTGIQRPFIDAAGIVRPNDSIAAIKDAEELRGKLPKPGTTNNVPNVAGADVLVVGQNQSGGIPKVPGVTNPGGPTVNLPGSQFNQHGPREVPGFGDGTGGAGHLNVPGSTEQHSADEATKKLSELEKADQQLLNQAAKGGVNSLNTSAGLAPGERESDKYGAEAGSGAAGQNFVNTGRPVDPVVNTGKPMKVWTSKGSDLNGGTVVMTNVSSDTLDQTTIVQTSKDGTTTTKVTSYDPKTIAILWTKTTTTGSDGKNNTPNDDSSNSHDIGSLAPGSSLGRMGQGGGTDNNGTESASSQASQLAPGAASGRTGHGDGNDGRGDNNHVGNDGTLAAGSALARKDQGDGGGSDTRESGSTMGGVKVQPGGNPSQSNLTAAAAMRN